MTNEKISFFQEVKLILVSFLIINGMILAIVYLTPLNWINNDGGAIICFGILAVLAVFWIIHIFAFIEGVYFWIFDKDKLVVK
jgi:uncharacterized membrane protein YqjE